MKYRKKPVVIEATQWFRNGDHPGDHLPIEHAVPSETTLSRYDEYRAMTEGKIVRRFRRPDTKGGEPCQHCGKIMHVHGWIDTLEGGHIVCPGDWVITGVKGERYPCKPDVFSATYEPAK